MALFQADPHFKMFSDNVDKKVVQKKTIFSGRKFYKLQKTQVESLVKLEEKFKKTLIKSSMGNKSYKFFINYIMNDKRNLLVARPYFRERQKVFARKITPAIKASDLKELKKYRINYPFIRLIMDNFNIPKRGKLNKIHKEIVDLRNEMIELNLPMAINRAKRFWSRTQESHLSYMDLIQIANEGLIIAIDKFVPPFTSVFRSVIIGRISCNSIQNYSETLLHFYPSDRKTIYLANKARVKNPDLDAITESVNIQDTTQSVTVSQVQDLMNASSTVGIDTLATPQTNNEEKPNVIDIFAAPVSSQPDKQIEEMDLMSKLFKNINQLSLFERKLLMLVYGDLQ